jgi:site-specific recombinase XerD
VHHWLAELSRVAKVEVHPYSLQHTFNKILINADVSLEKVASLLGYSSLNTTRIFTKPGKGIWKWPWKDWRGNIN